jgi:DNA-binding transcriptional ArsR family regulator
MSETHTDIQRQQEKEITTQNKRFSQVQTPQTDIKDITHVQEKASRYASVFIKVSMHPDMPASMHAHLMDIATKLLTADTLEACTRAGQCAVHTSRALTLSGLLGKESGEVLSNTLDAWLSHVESLQKRASTANVFSWEGDIAELHSILDGAESTAEHAMPTASRMAEGHHHGAHHNSASMSSPVSYNNTSVSDTLSERKPRAPETPQKKQSPKKNRRAQILAILQEKDTVTVKDIAQEITDCSEKTLQRELVALTQQGVLKKYGERRWSRYTLA